MAESPDDERLRLEGELLADAIETALPAFLQRAIVSRLRDVYDDLPQELDRRAAVASRAGLDLIKEPLWRLLRADVDEQFTTPLSLVRVAIGPATELLSELEVPAPPRDRFLEQRFPNDLYQLYPTKLDELGAVVGERAITWGAAKAYVHRRRHQSR